MTLPAPTPAPSADGLWTNLRTGHAGAPPTPGQALIVRAGRIDWIGPQDAVPEEARHTLVHHEGKDAFLMPGLVDCHTHLVHAGHRADEFAQRLAGVRYEDIARAGGGIASTVRATRAADEDTLFAQSARRLHALLDEGVCAVEIKSGYGLDLATERRQLRVARRLGEVFGVTVRTTFLGAHALPPEFAGRADDYITEVCEHMLPALADEGLVDAVDVFCEHIAFDLAQTARVFDAAARRGLPVKAHAGQLSEMGAATLAARHGALSCDHVEHLSAEAIAAMRAAGTVAVLLPGAYYTLRDDHPPPVAALRAAGVPMAVSTDLNPGTSPALSLLLMASMACTLFRLTVPEALDGITVHAARALGLQDRHGTLAPGRPADFVLWDIDSPAELVAHFGHPPPRTLVRQGRLVRDDLGVRHAGA
jgi:imidazolonepropionase